MPHGEQFLGSGHTPKPSRRRVTVKVRSRRGAGGTAMPTARPVNPETPNINAAHAARINRQAGQQFAGEQAQVRASGRARRIAFRVAKPLPTTVADDRQVLHDYTNFLKQTPEMLTGYREIEHIGSNPIEGGIALAGLIPGFRGARALGEFGKAAHAAEEGSRLAEGAQAAQESFKAGKGLLGPAARASGRGAKKVGQRVFKVGDLEAKQAHADSHIGRAVERTLDRHRHMLSKVGLMNSTEEKAGRRAAASIKARADVGTSSGDALLTIVRRPKWTRSKDYALRILSEHSLPGNTLSVADRRAFHLSRAEEMKAAGDKVGATYHRIHARLIKSASRYLHEGPDGYIALRDDAPKNLKEAWRLLRKTAAGREDVYRDIGRLSDQQIARRIQAPARVFQGARWMPDEKVIQKVLDENPTRTELFHAIDRTVEDPKQAQAAKDMIDASARHYADLSAAEGNHDPVAAVDELFSHLKGTAVHEPVKPNPFDHLSDEQLYARSETLNKRYDKLVDDLAAGEGRPGDYKTVTAIQNAYAKKLARKGIRQPTVKEQFRAIAEAKLLNLLESHPDEPAVQRLRAEIDEANGISKEISRRNDVALGIDDESVPETGVPEAALENRAHTGVFGDENYGPVKGGTEVTPPPSSAGEVFLNAADKAGVPIKGTHEATSVGSIIHLVQGHADVSTVIHEWGHFLRSNVLTGHTEDVAAKWAGSTFDKEAGQWAWDTKAEEKFARGLEQWAREGNGPGQLKGAWKTAAKALREIYDHTDLPDVSPDMRGIFDRLFSFEKQKGGRLLGAEDFHYGVNYVPYTRGAPVALSREARTFGAYIRHRLQLFNPSKASAIGAGPDDVTLRKTFTGALIRSGNFKADVGRASVRSLHTAWRLQSAKMARDTLLTAAEDLPRDATWLAIKVDPTRNLGEDVKRYWDRIHSVGTEKMTADDLGELDHADENSVDEFVRDLFPGEIDGQKTEDIAQQLSARAGEDLAGLQEPIDNIKWIPKELLDATGLTQIPAASNLALRGLTKQQRIAAKATGLAFDAFNDVQRAGLLILSPSYIPVNLVGNVAMNVLHQGPLAFPNLIRSVFLHRELELEDRVALDKLMGHGIMESVLALKSGPGQIINHTIGHWSGIVVDLAPRRAAFLHEARKAGYRTADELRSLMHDEANTEDLVRVRDKATEAIVDYERLSPFERNIVTRAIFVYPWIKGATHYSVRFAANHPVETMALALMADNAVDNANAELGPRPFYAQMEIPVSTKSVGLHVPGTNLGVDLSQAVGEHEMVGKNGLPYTVNPRQLLTQTTPYELGAEIAGTAGAPGLESLAGSFNPGLTTLASFIAGYDPNSHKEVPQNLSGIWGLAKENFAAVNKVKAVNSADPANRRKLYPRSRNEAIESFFLSGLAPKPFNTAKANALMTAGAAAPSPEEEAHQWVAETEKVIGEKLPHEVIVARNSKATYEDLEKAAAKETPTGKLSDIQHTRLLLHVLVTTHPEFKQYEKELWNGISQDPSASRTWIEGKLGWDILDRLSAAVNAEQKAKKLAKTHG